MTVLPQKPQQNMLVQLPANESSGYNIPAIDWSKLIGEQQQQVEVSLSLRLPYTLVIHQTFTPKPPAPEANPSPTTAGALGGVVPGPPPAINLASNLASGELGGQAAALGSGPPNGDAALPPTFASMPPTFGCMPPTFGSMPPTFASMPPMFYQPR
jgi:hypothetical protein